MEDLRRLLIEDGRQEMPLPLKKSDGQLLCLPEGPFGLRPALMQERCRGGFYCA